MVSGHRRAFSAWPLRLMLTLAPVLASCGEDTAVGPTQDLEFLVGDWDATRFVVQSKANPEVAPDLIGGLGAQFFMNVQPSGQYTATLVFQASPITDIGLLQVDGDDVIFHVNVPSPAINRSRYTLFAGGMTLVGDTEFAFIPGGEPEAAVATIDLEKR